MLQSARVLLFPGCLPVSQLHASQLFQPARERIIPVRYPDAPERRPPTSVEAGTCLEPINELVPMGPHEVLERTCPDFLKSFVRLRLFHERTEDGKRGVGLFVDQGQEAVIRPRAPLKLQPGGRYGFRVLSVHVPSTSHGHDSARPADAVRLTCLSTVDRLLCPLPRAVSVITSALSARAGARRMGGEMRLLVARLSPFRRAREAAASPIEDQHRVIAVLVSSSEPISFGNRHPRPDRVNAHLWDPSEARARTDRARGAGRPRGVNDIGFLLRRVSVR